MANLDRLLRKFIDNEIRLSKSDIMASAASRNWLLERIKSKIESKPNSIQLHPKLPFYHFGSYFKGTKVTIVDEYDVLVVIDSNDGQFINAGVKTAVGLGMASPNPKYNGQYYLQDSNDISTNKILNWLKLIADEVVNSFGGEAPIRNGQATTATIKSSNIKIDLVPAGIFQDINTNEVFFIIPEGDRNNSWILTNPVKDKEVIEFYANGRNDFKNIIRLLKFIRDKYNMQISSFAIECCVCHYVNSHVWLNNLSKNFMGSLAYLRDCLRAKVILDTFNKNKNLIIDLNVNVWYADRIDTILNFILGLNLLIDESDAYNRLYKILNNIGSKM